MGGEDHVVDLDRGADEEAGEREEREAEAAGQGGGDEGLRSLANGREGMVGKGRLTLV